MQNSSWSSRISTSPSVENGTIIHRVVSMREVVRSRWGLRRKDISLYRIGWGLQIHYKYDTIISTNLKFFNLMFMKIFLFVASVLFFVITFPAFKIGGSEMFAVIIWYIVVAWWLLWYYQRESIQKIISKKWNFFPWTIQNYFLNFLQRYGGTKISVSLLMATCILVLIWIQTNSVDYICGRSHFSWVATNIFEIPLRTLINISSCWISYETPENIRNILISLHNPLSVIVAILGTITLWKLSLISLYKAIKNQNHWNIWMFLVSVYLFISLIVFHIILSIFF